MRALTQPLHPSMSNSRRESSSAELSTSSGSARLTNRRHNTYRDLFQTGLAGTEFACLPMKKRSPLVQLSSSRGARLGASGTALNATEVKILPEDPVEAFSKTEQAAMQESPGRSGDKRALTLSNVLKQAIYKEDGVLAQARRSADEQQISQSQVSRPGPAVVGAALQQPELGLLVDPPQHAAAEDATAEAVPEAVPLGATGEISVAPALSNADTSTGAGEPTEAPACRKSNDFWSGILDPVLPKQRMSPLRREACQLLRLFIFSSVGNEHKKGAKEKERVLYEAIGTKEQVRLVYTVWDRLDTEGNNCVDFQEFRQLAERLANDWRQDRRPSVQGNAPRREDGLQMALLGTGTPEDNARFVAKLCEKLGQTLVAKKSTVCIEDIMRFLWPCAGVPELKQMKAWCEDFALSNARWRVPTPKVCPPSRVEELKAVFRYFDKDSHGAISSEDLVRAGLMDRETAWKCFNAVDGDGSGELEMPQFCEIMCPTGFRANSRAETATTKDGERVLFDRRLQCWRLEDTSGRSGLP